jgi:ABC-2 type transport system permease protein
MEVLMKALTKLTITEFKLFLRDPGAAFFTLAFPLLLLILNGTGRTNKPVGELGGHGVIDVIVPMLTVVVLAILAFTCLPSFLAGYRERRILKRLAATPLPASFVLVAQFFVNLLVGTAALIGLVVVGVVGYDLNPPKAAFAALAVFLLGGLALFALGFLLAAVAPTARFASAAGFAIFFPLLFLSGTMQPREEMPESLGRIGDFLPLSPVVRSLRGAWVGETPSGLTFALFAAIIVVAGGVALRLFRWE